MKKTIVTTLLSLFLIGSISSQNGIPLNADFKSWTSDSLTHWSITGGTWDNVEKHPLGFTIKSNDGAPVTVSQKFSLRKNHIGFVDIKLDIATEELGDRAMFMINLYATDSSFIGQKYFWKDAPLSNRPTGTYGLSLLNQQDLGMIELMLVITKGGTAHFGNIDVSYSNADHGQEKWISWIDTFVHICKNNSIKAAEVEWDLVDDLATSFAPQIKSSTQAHALGGSILQIINDGHSFTQGADSSSKWKGSNSEESEPVDLEAQFDHPEYKMVSKDIGYLTIPHIGSGDDRVLNAFALKIREALHELIQEGSKKWVVDLRGNTGGNMWPMIAGIGPLLGNDTLGGFKFNGGQSMWSYNNGASLTDNGPQIMITTDFKLEFGEEYPQIAVLVGKRTSSSGEFTFMSFVGRDNYRSFGSETGGYTTGNQNFDLPDGSMLFLATSVGIDRNGKAYGKTMLPDEQVKDDPETESDEVLDRAIQWLKED